MEKLHVTVIKLDPLPTNCYIVHRRTQAVVIDPGGMPEPIIDFLHAHNLTLTHIFLTHLHSDHTVGAGPLAREYAVPIFASAKDSWMLDDYLGKGDDDWGIAPVERFSFNALSAGAMPVLDCVCDVLETPGHSPGSLSFYFKSFHLVFTGDTLFWRSMGRTDFSGGDPAALEESLQQKIFQLPDKTQVFPGHGKSFLLKDSLLFTEMRVKKHTF